MAAAHRRRVSQPNVTGGRAWPVGGSLCPCCQPVVRPCPGLPNAELVFVFAIYSIAVQRKTVAINQKVMPGSEPVGAHLAGCIARRS
ncbi:hypothetical protein K437DRAFT_114154 [Tilletiaria anomala UBC 951]|uniref:Uncharacterized protein n=1 Tax=Tilletiaria anomala (strain ATCC 24038 / CBS 436.72 / UBC 951) TaxID=1037660 RepID=A0A066W066_TILAU|nr:uncharacterized protein K437DRAFT_114154 [Tilletiaria anomala UBC 951]KDN45918.1 hypothetical protein K437DRAFT_114154 [Tilletiaria anomala UBC 951]